MMQVIIRLLNLRKSLAILVLYIALDGCHSKPKSHDGSWSYKIHSNNDKIFILKDEKLIQLLNSFIKDNKKYYHPSFEDENVTFFTILNSDDTIFVRGRIENDSVSLGCLLFPDKIVKCYGEKWVE